MWRLILLTGIFINVILLTHGGKAKGKKIFMDWEKLVDCPGFENKDINSKNVSVFRGDETALSLRGSFSIETDIITPPLKFTFVVERQLPSGGSYRSLSYEMGDICDKILKKGTVWESYMRSLQPLPPERCPIYKQEYNVDALKCNLDKMTLTKNLVGKYIGTLELFRPMEEPTKPGLRPPLTKFFCKNLHFVIDTE